MRRFCPLGLVLDWPSVVLLLVSGLAAGFVSGLMGVGGGIVLTPVLHYGLRLSWEEAVATSLLVIAIQAPLGIWRHARRGAVDWPTALSLAAGGLFGVATGDVLLPHLPLAALRLLFALVMAWAAFRLVARPVQARTQRHPVWVLLAVGVGAGVVSRLLGVGGGILTVPALGLLGFPVHTAVGSSLVPVFTNAAAASGANLARGLEWTTALLLAAGALPGTFFGVWTAHALPEEGLRRVVAGALLVAALLVAGTAF